MWHHDTGERRRRLLPLSLEAGAASVLSGGGGASCRARRAPERELSSRLETLSHRGLVLSRWHSSSCEYSLMPAVFLWDLLQNAGRCPELCPPSACLSPPFSTEPRIKPCPHLMSRAPIWNPRTKKGLLWFSKYQGALNQKADPGCITPGSCSLCAQCSFFIVNMLVDCAIIDSDHPRNASGWLAFGQLGNV